MKGTRSETLKELLKRALHFNTSNQTGADSETSSLQKSFSRIPFSGRLGAVLPPPAAHGTQQNPTGRGLSLADAGRCIGGGAAVRAATAPAKRPGGRRGGQFENPKLGNETFLEPLNIPKTFEDP